MAIKSFDVNSVLCSKGHGVEWDRAVLEGSGGSRAAECIELAGVRDREIVNGSVGHAV